MTDPLNNIQKLVSVYAGEVQTLEGVFWDIINKRVLDVAVDDQLDQLGKIVGEPRNSRNNVNYRAAVRIRIRVNRSQGKSSDVIDVATLSAINSTPFYYEQYPAGWNVDILNLPGGKDVAILLGSTKATGTYGVLHYSDDTMLTAARGFTGDTDALYLSGFTGDTAGGGAAFYAIGIAAGGT